MPGVAPSLVPSAGPAYARQMSDFGPPVTPRSPWAFPKAAACAASALAMTLGLAAPAQANLVARTDLPRGSWQGHLSYHSLGLELPLVGDLRIGGLVGTDLTQTNQGPFALVRLSHPLLHREGSGLHLGWQIEGFAGTLAGLEAEHSANDTANRFYGVAPGGLWGGLHVAWPVLGPALVIRGKVGPLFTRGRRVLDNPFTNLTELREGWYLAPLASALEVASKPFSWGPELVLGGGTTLTLRMSL